MLFLLRNSGRGELPTYPQLLVLNASKLSCGYVDNSPLRPKNPWLHLTCELAADPCLLGRPWRLQRTGHNNGECSGCETGHGSPERWDGKEYAGQKSPQPIRPCRSLRCNFGNTMEGVRIRASCSPSVYATKKEVVLRRMPLAVSKTRRNRQ